MEEIVVTGSRLPVWQPGFIRELSRQSYSMPRISERDGGGAGDFDLGGADPGTAPAGTSGGTSTPIEEIVVSASRLSGLANIAPALPVRWLLPPGVIALRGLMMIGAAGALASVGAFPIEISTSSDLLDADGQPLYVYHFTNDTGKRGIASSGMVLPGVSGLVYLSPMPYGSSGQAQSALSLPRAPTGFFMIPRSNVPGPLNWTVVGPNFNQPGGGLEAGHPGGVPLDGARWVPFEP
jgi:hypothetical protein